MRKEIIKTIYLKEVKTLIRDKKMMFSLFLPLLLFPFLGYFFEEVMGKSFEAAEKKVSNVYFINEMPEQFKNMVLDEELLNIVAKSEDYEKDIEDEKLDLALKRTREDITEKFELYFNSSKLSSERALTRIDDIINEYKKERQIEELQRLEHDISIIEPIDVELENLAEEKAIAGQALGNILPFILALYALLAVAAFAIELTTSEKENGTLETLFSMPIKRVEIITAKLFACVTLGFFSQIISIAAIIPVLPMMSGIENGAQYSLEPLVIIMMFLTIIPLSFIGSGLILGAGMFANSYKESSAYLTPIMLIFIFPAYLGLIPGIEINGFLATIPIANSVLLMKSILIGEISSIYFAMVSSVNIMAAVLSISFVFKIFGTEKIIFGSGQDFSLSFNRKEIKKVNYIEAQDAFIIGAVSIIMFIYTSMIFTNIMDFAIGQMLAQIVSFAIIPIFAVWYLRGDIVRNLGLYKPGAKDSIMGFLLWLGTFILMLIYGYLISEHLTSPTLQELEDILMNLSPVQKIFMIAIVPAITEEILFRGVLFRSFEKKIGVKSAIILTSIFFATAHLDILRLLPTFLLGVVFGVIAYKTSSLFIPIILHFLNNATSLILSEDVELNLLYVMAISIPLLLGGYMITGKSTKNE